MFPGKFISIVKSKSVKWLLAACLVLFCFSFLLQEDAPILWKKKNLRWKNFKGAPATSGPFAKALAVTNSKLDQRYYRVGDEIHFVITAWFNPGLSWVKEEVLRAPIGAQAQVLDHEQHHFDMCELYARKIRKFLSAAVFKQDTYRDEIADLFKSFHEQYRAQQKRFDNETKEHTYTQDEWTESIDREMKELAKYSDTALVVKLQ